MIAAHRPEKKRPGAGPKNKTINVINLTIGKMNFWSITQITIQAINHSNNKPFSYRTHFNHLNAKLVHYSDPTVSRY